jgi:sugar lactone lactonase YvrE
LTITDATPGAEIYVSLNGSAPTTLDQGYHGPIEITGSVTVQAVAVGPGYLASAPVSATYTITTPPAAVISTVAGDGVFGMLGIGGAAASAEIGEPVAVTFDGAGNLYIADGEKYVVWMVSATTGEITIVAGNGTFGYAGDGGPATAAELGGPDGLAVDKAGNLYIADGSSDRIRMVTAQTGVITTIAGPGVYGTLGDGGPATSAFLRGPGGIGFDSAGNLYIADSGNNRIRMIAAKTGIISTVAGGGVSGLLGDGGLATAATLSNPDDLALDSAADLYITDFYDGRVRRVDAATGLISTVAGNGVLGDNGDGGLATEAEIDSWRGIAVDGAGNLYLSNLPDTLRKVDATTGIITTIAGDGYFGYGGDGGAATMAELYEPKGLAFDAAENLYIADSANYRVRKLTFPQPQPQTIVFTPPSPVYYGIPSITLTATGGASGNPVTFSIVSGPGSLSGTNNSILKVTGTGAIVIAANQAGNASYAAATQVTSNISVVSPAAAALTSPAPGTVLAGSSVTFNWSGAADPTGYYLWIGSTGVGSNNIYNSEEKAVTTYTFNGLPTNGETIYVRLITNFNGTWVPRDYTYTAARKGVPMTSPTPGSTLGGSSVTFTWSTVSGATGYYLWIGTTGTGSSDLYYSAEKTVNSYTFTRMPTNGEKIYVRLTTNYSGIWAYNDYTYTSSAPAALTSPAAGATLAGPDVTFDWAAAPNATGYYLWIGSTGVGSNNIYNSAEKTGTSYTFNGLPTNGETLYVRLTTNYNGTWVHNDYTYTAATQAVLTSPTLGSTLSGRSVAFEWTAATGATGYYLWIGSTGTGSNNIYNSALKTVTAYTFPSMPMNGETIYVRLTTNFNGVWVHQDYTYTAAPSQP